jgi:hypothetical protein
LVYKEGSLNSFWNFLSKQVRFAEPSSKKKDSHNILNIFFEIIICVGGCTKYDVRKFIFPDAAEGGGGEGRGKGVIAQKQKNTENKEAPS